MNTRKYEYKWSAIWAASLFRSTADNDISITPPHNLATLLKGTNNIPKTVKKSMEAIIRRLKRDRTFKGIDFRIKFPKSERFENFLIQHVPRNMHCEFVQRVKNEFKQDIELIELLALSQPIVDGQNIELFTVDDVYSVGFKLRKLLKQQGISRLVTVTYCKQNPNKIILHNFSLEAFQNFKLNFLDPTFHNQPQLENSEEGDEAEANNHSAEKERKFKWSEVWAASQFESQGETIFIIAPTNLSDLLQTSTNPANSFKLRLKYIVKMLKNDRGYSAFKIEIDNSYKDGVYQGVTIHGLPEQMHTVFFNYIRENYKGDFELTDLLTKSVPKWVSNHIELTTNDCHTSVGDKLKSIFKHRFPAKKIKYSKHSGCIILNNMTMYEYVQFKKEFLEPTPEQNTVPTSGLQQVQLFLNEEVAVSEGSKLEEEALIKLLTSPTESESTAVSTCIQVNDQNESLSLDPLANLRRELGLENYIIGEAASQLNSAQNHSTFYYHPGASSDEEVFNFINYISSL